MVLPTNDLLDKIERIGIHEQKPLLDQIHSKNFDGYLKDFSSPPLELAHQLLPLAAAFAQVPVSGFRVGAIAIGSSGHLYLGANMEFVGGSLSASLHAEQSALLNAWMHGEPSIEALVVSEAPCGFCRQFLREVHGADRIQIFFGEQVADLGSLLPHPFGAPRKLGEGLLDSSPFTLESIRSITNDAAQRALNAAQRSYAPYTRAPEGFVIECINGSAFAGRTAESAAFNPTVPALTCALNQRNLSSSRNFSISSCTHARLATGLNSQSDFSHSILRRLTNAPIETVLLETA